MPILRFFMIHFPSWFCHRVLDQIRHLKSPELTLWISKFMGTQLELMFSEDLLSNNLSSSLCIAIEAKNDKLVEHKYLSKLIELNPEKIDSVAKIFFRIHLVIHRRDLLLLKRRDLRQQIFKLRACGEHVDHTLEMSKLQSELNKLALRLKDEPEMEFAQKTQAM